jgi:quercetin dioxygenase-like cupin family protein
MKLGAALLLAAGITAFTNAATDSVPGYLDPHHHIRLQNGYVRVMETRLEPGEVTLPHSHPIEAAVVFLTEGTFQITSDDGSVQVSNAKASTVAFGDSAIVHRTKNIGDTVARTITVEIFSQPPAPGELGADFSLGDTLLNNEKVLVARLRIKPQELVELSGLTPTVLVALSSGALGQPDADSPRHLGVGDVLWSEPGVKAVRSYGNEHFEAIIISLKPRR